MRAIVRQSDSLREASREQGFGFRRTFDFDIDAMARAVFKSINGVEREAALKEIFEDPEHLCTAADLLRDQHLASGKSDYEKAEEYYLSEEELAQVTKTQVQLYEELTPDQLRSLPAPYNVLYAWRDATSSNQGPSDLLERAFVNDEGVITTLGALKYVTSSSQGGVPHVPEDFLEKFVDIKALRTRVEAIASSESDRAPAAADLLNVWWSKDRI